MLTISILNYLFRFCNLNSLFGNSNYNFYLNLLLFIISHKKSIVFILNLQRWAFHKYLAGEDCLPAEICVRMVRDLSGYGTFYFVECGDCITFCMKMLTISILYYFFHICNSNSFFGKFRYIIFVTLSEFVRFS